MRQFRVADDEYDDDDRPRVVPIRPGSGLRGGPGRPSPWTPRDVSLPDAPRHQTSVAPARSRGWGASRIAVTVIAVVAVGLTLGLLLVRLWDDASRAVAVLPTSGLSSVGSRANVQPPSASAAPAQVAPEAEPAGRGAITTEIRVLQPNYTVAPGDTLGSIARKHGTSVDALASINNLENRNALGVGQRLIIP